MRLLWILLSSLLAVAPPADCGDTHEVRSIAFSPDGEMLAFTVGDHTCKLFLGRTTGTGSSTTVTAIADLVEPCVSWSSDSRWLAYTSDRGGSWDIWAWDADVGKRSRVTRHLAKDHLATFWPGSSVILFVSTRGRRPDVWRVAVHDGGPTQITDDADAESDLSVSADGSFLVYRATDAEGQSKIAVRSYPQGAVASFVPPSGSLGLLRVAPDAEALAFASKEGLYVADLSRQAIGAPKLVVERAGRQPMTFDWSPDSDALLASNGQCIIRRSLGWFGREKRLTTPQFDGTLPTCHPDGRRFAYVAKGARVALAPLRAPETCRWLVYRTYERRRGRGDSALTQPPEASSEGKQAFLSAWNEEIARQLTIQSDADAALAAVMKLPELVGRQGHEVDHTALVEAVHRCVCGFDRAGSYESGSQALRTLLPLLGDAEGLADLLSQQAAHLVDRLSPTPFVECRLGHLPKWLHVRIKIVLARLEAVAEPDRRQQLGFALRLLQAWRPADVERLLKPVATQWGAGSTLDETRHMLTAGYYVLANFYQTRRDFTLALDYYDKLLRVAERERIKGYAPVIAECRELLPRRPHIVRQWLELERSIAYGPWEPVAFISSAARQQGWGGISSREAWRRDVARAATAGYEEFLRKHGKASLADDAELRLIELSSDSRLQALRAERFLANRPTSRLFPAALGAYVKASRRQNTPWLAATFLTDLTKGPDYVRHLPVLRSTIGDLMPRTR